VNLHRQRPLDSPAFLNRPLLINETRMAKVLVLHGPNLNLLGTREPTHYGNASLEDINQALHQLANDTGNSVVCFQNNAEFELIERIHSAGRDGTQFIIINPAAFTHTSVALRDALMAVGIPFVEVHLSNVHAREAFRHHSYFSDVAQAVICGMGPYGYEAAVHFAFARLKQPGDSR
jgi:3-dehydroquinate dehydratase-2